jgi:hypothetical protein
MTSKLLYQNTNISQQHAEARQPVLESIYNSSSTELEPIQHGYGLRSRQQQQERGQEGVELRFSFSQAADGENIFPKGPLCRNVFREAQEGRNCEEVSEVVNRSFSNLSFEQGSPTVPNSPRSRSMTPTDLSRPLVPYATKAKATGAWARQTSAGSRLRSSTPQVQTKPLAAYRMPTIPELSKPKREGYGFSYSESAFYDSKEYPDTECGSVSPTKQGFITEDNANVPSQDTSFDDLVVVREVGSFHLARPQRRLPCTTATREDTIGLKTAAKNLLKFEESQDVYVSLVGRLERMVCTSLASNGGETSAAMMVCAAKLRNFLVKVAKERVETGDVQALVEHEIEWAKWLVEASHTGVMHLKGVGCQCTPDWEE